MSTLDSRPESAKISRTAIIGMGPGGMAAAMQVAGDCFEAGDDVGGRIQTVKMGNATGEMGGEFFNKNQVENGPIGRLIQNIHKILGPSRVKLLDLTKTGKSEEAMSFATRRGIVSEAELNKEFGESLWQQVQNEVAKAGMGGDMTLNVLNADAVRKSRPRLAQLDRMTLEEYIDGLNASPQMKNVLRITYETLNHLPVGMQSALNGIELLRSSPRHEFNPFGTHDDGTYIVQGGGRQLTGAMREVLEKKGRRVRFGHRLLKIKAQPSGTYELTFEHDGKRITKFYENVIINLPLPMLARLEDLDQAGFTPEQIAAIKSTKYGQGGKTLFGITDDKWNGLGSDGIRTANGISTKPFMLWNTFSNGKGNVLTRLESEQFDPKNPEEARQYYERLARDTDIVLPGTLKHLNGSFARSTWVQQAGGTYPTPTPGYYQDHFGALSKNIPGRLFLVGDFPRTLANGKNDEYGYINTTVGAAEEVAKKLNGLLAQ